MEEKKSQNLLGSPLPAAVLVLLHIKQLFFSVQRLK